MKKLVRGVGINDGKYPATINGKVKKEYELWNNMLNRCYSENYHKKNPTYLGCTVSDSFKDYTYFHEWCQSQIGFNAPGYTLDKDLIYKGNKEYNEDNCVFIPNIVNTMLIKSNSIRGNLPIGITKNGNNFAAMCNADGKLKYIGTYKTIEEAFQAYKFFKEAHIKEVAEKYKDTIDSRAYQALLNYEVHIND